MNNVKKIIYGSVRELSRGPIFLLSNLFPSRKNFWVVVAGHEDVFFDNSKYMYLYLENEADEDVVYAGCQEELAERLNDEGYSASVAGTFEDYWNLLRAEYLFFDYGKKYWHFSGNSTTVNLWHGLPIKKIGYDSPVKKSRESNFFLKYLLKLYREFLVQNYDYYVATSNVYPSELMQRAFGAEEEEVLDLGYPRNDVLLKQIDGSQIGVVSEELQDIENSEQRILFYLPTFRQYDVEYGFDFDSLQNVLEENSTIMYISLHPNDDLNLQENFKNIKLISSTDNYPLMRYADALITDYSSVFYDFLLLDKPIIFYPFDLSRYREVRDLYPDYEDHVPGPIVKTQEELQNQIANIFEEDEYAEERKELINRIHKYQDGSSAERLYSFLREN